MSKTIEQKIASKGLKIKDYIVKNEIYTIGNWVDVVGRDVRFYSNNDNNYFNMEFYKVSIIFSVDRKGIELDFDLSIPLTKVLSLLNKTYLQVKKLGKPRVNELKTQELKELVALKKQTNRRIKELKNLKK